MSYFSSWIIERAYAQELPSLNTSPLPSEKAGEGLTILANRLIDLLLAVAYPLAFAAIVYSAYILITSAGKPEAYVATKKNLGFLVTGVVIIIAGLYVVRFVVTIFGPK